ARMRTQCEEEPPNVRIHCPVVTSQSRTVRSLLAEASRVPSRPNATLQTHPVCPVKGRISCPVATSHSLTVASMPPEAIHLPSELTATLRTPPVCPLNVRRS